MAQALSGKLANSTTLNLYSAVDDVNRAYTRNVDLWLPNVDITCIPVSNTSATNKFNGLLVTDDILIQANHAHSSGTVYFLDNNNNTTSRYIVGGQRLSNTDVWVSRLNAPVDAAIKPAPILPLAAFSGTSVYFKPSHYVGRNITCVYTNQQRQLQLGDVGYLTNYAGVYRPLDTNRDDWYASVIGGDSDSAVLFVITGTAVALGVWYASDLVDFSIAPNIALYKSEINTIITNLGSSTQLVEIDLSAYNRFPA